MLHRPRELLAGLLKVSKCNVARFFTTKARRRRHGPRKILQRASEVYDKRRDKHQRLAWAHSSLANHPKLHRHDVRLNTSKDILSVERIAPSAEDQSHQDVRTHAVDTKEELTLAMRELTSESEGVFDNHAEHSANMGKDAAVGWPRRDDHQLDRTVSTFDISANSDDDLTAHDVSNQDGEDSDNSYVDIDMLDSELKPPEPNILTSAATAQVMPAESEAAFAKGRYDRNPQPRFQIPESKWQLITATGTASLRGHWTYELYRDARGNQPKVHYCKTLAESEACAKLFLKEEMIGFDMEWKPSYHKKRSQANLAKTKLPWSQVIKLNASLIQLGSENHIGLFHIAAHPGTRVSELMAPSLKGVLESPSILKTGVNILNADGKRVERFLGVKCRGLFELGHLHNIIETAATDPERKFASKGLTSLAKLTLKHLHLPLNKGAVRCSDWSRPLNLAQVRYSASDAYVGYHLFRVMNEKRLAFKHVPPLPSFAELCLPVPMRQPEASIIPNHKSATINVPTIPKIPKDEEAVLHKRIELSITAERSTLDREGIHAFDALRALRAIIAAEKSIPEYHIAHDKTLLEIARQRPLRLKELKTIRGLGNHNIELYGTDWIRIVNEAKIFACEARVESGAESLEAPGGLSDNWRPPFIVRGVPDQVILQESDQPPLVTESVRPTATSNESLSSIKLYGTRQEGQPATVDRRHVFTPDSRAQIQRDMRERRILSVLTGLRSQLARKAGVLRSDIVSDQALREVAHLKARNDIEVESMTGFMQLDTFAANWGTSLSEFITKYDVQAAPVVSYSGEPLKQISAHKVNGFGTPSPAQDSAKAVSSSGSRVAALLDESLKQTSEPKVNRFWSPGPAQEGAQTFEQRESRRRSQRAEA